MRRDVEFQWCWIWKTPAWRWRRGVLIGCFEGIDKRPTFTVSVGPLRMQWKGRAPLAKEG